MEQMQCSENQLQNKGKISHIADTVVEVGSVRPSHILGYEVISQVASSLPCCLTFQSNLENPLNFLIHIFNYIYTGM